MFFEEVPEEPAKKCPFEKDTPINLRYTAKETKVLRMVKLKERPKPPDTSAPEQGKQFVMKDSYKEILNKWCQGTLNIDDYFVNVEPKVKTVEKVMQPEPVRVETETTPNAQTVSDINVAASSPTLETEETQPDEHTNTTVVKEAKPLENVNKASTSERYKQLKQLSRQPLKSRFAPEVVTSETPPISKKKYLQIFKNMLIHDTEQDPLNLDVQDDKIDCFVSIPHSVQDGVIVSTTDLTNDDKAKLLNPSNFKNFTPFMKVIVLKDYLKAEEEAIKEMGEEELRKEDEYGWNPSERCELLQSLIEALRFSLEARLSAANDDSDSDNAGVESDVEKMNVT